MDGVEKGRNGARVGEKRSNDVLVHDGTVSEYFIPVGGGGAMYTMPREWVVPDSVEWNCP
jgi:hypothetical protein